jgi:hypothetical protein
MIDVDDAALQRDGDRLLAALTSRRLPARVG